MLEHESNLDESDDLSKPIKKGAGDKADIIAEKEALKADLRRMQKKKSGKNTAGYGSSEDSDPDMANTGSSNFIITLGKYTTFSL